MKHKKIPPILGIALSLLLFLYPVCRATTSNPGKNGAVVSVDEYATQVGIEILKKGGNAVDAAVAVGFALAVTYPAAGNIGGGGFMLVRFPESGETTALDFREKAPGKATPDMYLDELGMIKKNSNMKGHPAVGVPGTVMGFYLAMEKYGSLKWKEVIQPAVELAENGFLLSKERADSFNWARKHMATDNREFLNLFTKPDESDWKQGDLFVQSDLAESLKLIGDQGPDAFYKGKIAELILSDMHKHGGLITKEDLLNYQAVERKPVEGTYRDTTIISMPPPSSGGIALIEMLNVLEGYDLAAHARYAPETLHLITETMKFAFYDRARFLGDSDFSEIPADRLTSKEYAAEIRARIDSDRAIPSNELGAEILTIEESSETTHYSVIDRKGLAVATTYTLNGGFGAGVVTEGTGILLNNEMGDFNPKPGLTDERGRIGTEPNLIAPHKRMLSSMTPTIVVKDGKTFLITGSPGGRTIINTVINILINVIDYDMTVREAVDAPRMDHEWMPDILRVEFQALTEEVRKILEDMGHRLMPGRRWRQGDAHSIMVDPKTGIYHGAADPRSEGSAVVYQPLP